MDFRFEYNLDGDEWEPVGVGDGVGDTAAFDAFNKLSEEGGDGMRVGTYRAKPDGMPQESWFLFRLTMDEKLEALDVL